MKTLGFFRYFLLVLSSVSTYGQLSDAQQKQFASQHRSAMQLDATCAKIMSGDIDLKRLAVIHAVLSATQEVFIHQQRGASENKVYLSPDGHKEAVYGSDGKLVSDGMNDGSYNYFHPQADPMRHFLFDIHPWVLWGASEKDPTSLHERIFAYVSDLERGITAASKATDSGKITLKELKAGEIEAYAILLRVIHEGGAEELFTLIENHRVPDSTGLVPLLRKIESGFRKVYKNGSS
jgi:hypothetical protein